MENLLTIIRFGITLPIWILEIVLKGLTFIVLVFGLIVMAILFPLFRSTWYNIKESFIYKYATKWKGNYPLTNEIFNLWQ